MSRALPTLGFIGTGTISAALVEGFCGRAKLAYPIVLSPRNAERAAALATAFPGQVRVAESNQQVVDEADWLILAVVPQVGQEVLTALTFRPEQKVVNLLSDKSLAQIRAWIGPTDLLVHLVPLPFVARQNGPIALYPPHDEAVALFAPLGQIVAVETAREIHLLAAITGLMAAYYTLLQEIVTWAGAYGLAELPAKAYTAEFLGALSGIAAGTAPGELQRLAAEMTPGGLNAMAKDYLTEQNAFAPWIAALEPVLARLEGK